MVSLKKFVENYLHGTGGSQNNKDVGANMMTFEILKIIRFMLHHGFYVNLQELKGIAIPMINLMNGSNDKYHEGNEQEDASEFVSVKR